ncbi:MAG: hypothetical protein K8T25_08145 [Planctomycetia bacterium]|nr:hypothetical protein [Planctomycetia bacterium]
MGYLLSEHFLCVVLIFILSVFCLLQLYLLHDRKKEVEKLRDDKIYLLTIRSSRPDSQTLANAIRYVRSPNQSLKNFAGMRKAAQTLADELDPLFPDESQP